MQVQPAAPSSRSTTDLFDTYVPDPRIVARDLESRPHHYTTEQKETLRRIIAGDAVPAGARSELVLQYMRRSEARRTEQQTRQHYTSRVVAQHTPPPFEQQGAFKDTIKLI